MFARRPPDSDPNPSGIDPPPLCTDPAARRIDAWHSRIDAEPFGIDSFRCRIDPARLEILAAWRRIDAFRGPSESASSLIQSISRFADAKTMATVPKPMAEKVAFYQAHLETFAENAAALGLSPEEVAELTAQTEAARAARIAQLEAQSAAQSATLRYNLAVEAMAKTGAAILEKIRSNARSSGDPALYSLALIPPRAKRSPLDVPGTPTRLTTTLRDGDGSLLLKWSCPNPRGSVGTVYQIYRSVGDGPFVYLGLVGQKRYADETIPKGATSILYKIQAVRSTKIGSAAVFSVSFGSNGAKPLPKKGYTPRHAIAPSLAA